MKRLFLYIFENFIVIIMTVKESPFSPWQFDLGPPEENFKICLGMKEVRITHALLPWIGDTLHLYGFTHRIGEKEKRKEDRQEIQP